MLSAFFAQATDTTYTTYDGGDVGAAAGGLFLFLIPALILGVITIVGMWKLFEKAGHPGWAAIIPIYNFYILLQIADKPTWWLASIFASIIPIVGPIVSLVVSVLVGIEVAKRFGKSEVFGAIVCGLLGIGYAIIGFDSSTYKGDKAAASPTNTSTPAATPPATPAA